MLSNAYFLAKFRFDTAENEPAKNLQNLNFANFPNFDNPTPSAESIEVRGLPGARRERGGEHGPAAPPDAAEAEAAGRVALGG